MKKNKFLYVISLILLVLLSSCSSAYETFNFNDVPDDHWAKVDIEFAVRRDLIRFTTRKEFFPDKYFTREEAARALSMLSGVGTGHIGYGYDNVLNYNNAMPFLELSVGTGVVREPQDKTLDRDDYITREQMAVMMMNCAGYLNKGPQGAWMIRLDFEDLEDISDWAFESVAFCYLKEIILPKDGNIFDPKGLVTRAEAAHLLHRFSIVFL